MKKVVLAYSGGLDTSVCIPWLKERGYEVVCFMADVGQNKDFKPAVHRAKVAGADKVIVGDLKREFAVDFIWPSLKANAIYENQYLLATALARPLIAKELVRVAHEEKATSVAHGCTGKGNDQVRFELTAKILDPKLETIAPVREWELKSRDAEIEYALERGIPIDVTKKSPYSTDENLWGVSIECGVLENPWTEPPQDCYLWTRGFESRKNLKPVYVTVGFEKGVPVSLNGRALDPLKLIASLNQTAGRFAIGRVDMVENRFVGIKSREIYEAPAAAVLSKAHQDLESLTLDRLMSQYKASLVPVYARLIYEGMWYTDLRKALDAFINESQKRVTGEVRLKLSPNHVAVVGRKSPYSLYREKMATYSEKDEFNQSHAKGFIELIAMPFGKDR